MSNATAKQRYTDEELVAQVQGGNQKAVEEIFSRHRGLVRSIARRFFLIGGESEDLIQEGMMGLYQAILDYKHKDGAFKSFAYLCVRRRIIDAVRRAARGQTQVLSADLQTEVDETQAGEPSPEDLIILDDDKRELHQKMSQVLSALEFQIIVMYIDGLSYAEICQTLGKPLKTIDNAIQRGRRKLEKVFTK